MKLKAFKRQVALAVCLAVPMLAMAQNNATEAAAPTAGATVLGVTQTVSTLVAKGWSVSHILGKNVYNDERNPSTVGKVDDIIVNPEGSVSYAVLNASRFLGLSRHLVLVPIEQFKREGDRIVLPGATRAALRNLPPFEYAK